MTDDEIIEKALTDGEFFADDMGARVQWEEARAALGRLTFKTVLFDAFLRALYTEVDCRIEHGAESGGHLEYVRNQILAVRRVEGGIT